MEVFVDDDAKLTLHGLQQYYVKLKENEKNRKLLELLDALEFNQASEGIVGCVCLHDVCQQAAHSWALCVTVLVEQSQARRSADLELYSFCAARFRSVSGSFWIRLVW